MNDPTKGAYVLITRPGFASYAVIYVYGDCPTVFPKLLERLMPGNHKGNLTGVVVSSNHSYLDYLIRMWPEGLCVLEETEMQEAEGLKYRLVVQQMMI